MFTEKLTTELEAHVISLVRPFNSLRNQNMVLEEEQVAHPRDLIDHMEEL